MNLTIWYQPVTVKLCFSLTLMSSVISLYVCNKRACLWSPECEKMWIFCTCVELCNNTMKIIFKNCSGVFIHKTNGIQPHFGKGNWGVTVMELRRREKWNKKVKNRWAKRTLTSKMTQTSTINHGQFHTVHTLYIVYVFRDVEFKIICNSWNSFQGHSRSLALFDSSLSTSSVQWQL